MNTNMLSDDIRRIAFIEDGMITCIFDKLENDQLRMQALSGEIAMTAQRFQVLPNPVTGS